MKYLTSYFPFVILSLLIYGLFFYFNHSSPLETKLQLQTGQQAIKMQLSHSLATPVTAKTEHELLDNAATKQLDKAILAEKEKLTAQQTAKQTMAKKQHRESIKKNTASTDAQLKEHIFNQEIATLKSLEPAKLKAAKITKTKKSTTTPTTAPTTSTITEESVSSIASLLPIAENTEKAANIQRSSKTKIIPKTPPKISSVEQSSPKSKEPPKIKRTFKPSSDKKSETSAAAKQGVLQDAVVISGNIPTYPNRAVLRMQQGRVVVKMLVMDSGKTKRAEIVKSSGYSILDEEVLAFISRELFLPALRGTDKITAEQLFSFRFELN